MTTAIATLIVFLSVITLHELGHFIVAKLVGIKVNEFSIGMGPLIYKNETEETQYSIRALPVGGYVAMEGEEEDSSDSRSFNNAPIISRMAVILAGAIMNFLLAILAFFLAFLIIGTSINVVDTVIENSPAQIAGIREGDIITSVEGNSVSNWNEVVANISESTSEEIEIALEREKTNISLSIRPVEEEGRKVIGITPKVSKNPGEAIKGAVGMTGAVVLSIFSFFKIIFQGQFESNMISGPIGVAMIIGQSAAQGIGSIMFILGIISANLGVFNLLPIPALDGGKLLFLAIEAIRGKPVDKEKEATITIISFVLLFSLILYITIFQDIGLLVESFK